MIEYLDFVSNRDESIPSLEVIINDDDDAIRNKHQILSQLLERQISLESKYNNCDKSSEDKTSEECTPPQICHDFQTARLFLSHFGFLNIEPKTNQDSSTGSSSLVALDPTIPGFCADLKTLDNISCRTCDTVHIFYVKTGQSNATEILNNVVSILFQTYFFYNFNESCVYSYTKPMCLLISWNFSMLLGGQFPLIHTLVGLDMYRLPGM